jgi:signal transduction histidine kinase
MPVVVPLSGREAAGIVSILSIGFVGPISLGSGAALGTVGVIHVLFLSASGLTSIASCWLLDRARLQDFLQRREIEKARDKLKELDEAKSRFTANIHHELRTPLTLTLAPLEAMLGGEFGHVSEMQRGYLETMHKNSLRLLKLINNLLDHARIESGQVELQRQPLDVERVVRDIVESARPMAERKHVVLEAASEGTLPPLNADPDALEKILVNLVGNALKFTDPGGRIAVRAAPHAASGEGGDGAVPAGVALTVSDTGAGIPVDQLERVFDRFAQVDASATRRHEGTGIGLSLVRELVELHGGRVWATSEGLGHGAQFHVFLPHGTVDASAEEVVRTDDGRVHGLRRSFDALAADLDHHEADAPASDGEHADPVHSERYRRSEMERTVERFEGKREAEDAPREVEGTRARPEVVIAEDNADMRRLLAHLLGAEFAVRPARHGREALAFVRERAPALVVTDVMMPEMSGTELCEAIKGDPALAGIPVMLVTSKAEREMKIRGLELGADDYVTKPFHPRELLARARSLVRLRELQEELGEQNAALDRALQHLKASEVALVQAERLAAVGELAAGIAHEVNNPVNFALNSLRVLEDTVGQVRQFAGRLAAIDWQDAAKLPERAAEVQRLEAEVGLEEVVATLDELVRIVTEGLERTSRLVVELRDFGAPGERERVPLDLRACLDSTLAMVGPLLARARVRVERAIEPDLPVVVADPSALKQVFLNLLKNAAEALEETGGTVRIAAGREGGGVIVSVADDGPGIDPAVRERVFEPFFTTKAAGRGTGLGLSICRRIAEAHGGALEVESTAGAGTTFTLRLPGEGSDATARRS